MTMYVEQNSDCCPSADDCNLAQEAVTLSQACVLIHLGYILLHRAADMCAKSCIANFEMGCKMHVHATHLGRRSLPVQSIIDAAKLHTDTF